MTQPVLSVQLYAVKNQLTEDLDGTLARLAEMGLRHVEAYDFVSRAPELAAAFERNGLTAKTGHAPLLSDELRFGDDVVPVPDQAVVFEAARTLGLDIVIDPYVATERWLDEAAVDDTAARLNRAAERAADYGLQVGYHNHSQEFLATVGGRTAFEYFADQLSDGVALEVDVYWAATGQQDVTALLKRLGERVGALHLKDGIIGPNPFLPGAPALDPATLDQRPAGQGELPMLDYLAATPSTRFGVIEFDHYAGDIFDGIRASVDYFTENGLR